MAIRGDIEPPVERFLAGMPVCVVCRAPVGSVWVKKLVSHDRYMVIVRCHGEKKVGDWTQFYHPRDGR